MRTIINIAIGIFIGLLVAGGLFLTVRGPSGTPVVLLPSSTPKPIFIYMTGAVGRPGVYKLPLDSRLVQAVQAAGGFADGADLNQVNLATVLKDGQQIVIPGGTGVPTPMLTIGDNGILVTATPPAGQPVNINTADVALLEKLPGIGPSSAQAIVDYRTANGPFVRIEDLLKIPGIGPTTMDGLKGLITVGP